MSFRTIYGYSVSENGWRMCNADECSKVQVVPAAKVVPLRRGDASTILNAWIIYHHKHIEPITSQVWGWSPYNDVPNSNHLSGTAIDVNAPKYPWGARTMPADVIARVRRGLAAFEGTIFWGADWARADEMHFQLGFPEGDKRIAAFAAKLNAGHLGIYSAAPAAPAKPAPPKGNPAVANIPDEVLASIDNTLGLILDQLAGPGGGFRGWPQLGGKTIVNALAEIGQKLGLDGYEPPAAKP